MPTNLNQTQVNQLSVMKKSQYFWHTLLNHRNVPKKKKKRVIDIASLLEIRPGRNIL